MRVAERVHVAHRPRDLPLRNVENLARCSEASRYPSAPGWIFAFRLCWMSGGSQPISSSRPTTIEQVGALELQDEARLRFDEVRILISAR